MFHIDAHPEPASDSLVCIHKCWLEIFKFHFRKFVARICSCSTHGASFSYTWTKWKLQILCNMQLPKHKFEKYYILLVVSIIFCSLYIYVFCTQNKAQCHFFLGNWFRAIDFGSYQQRNGNSVRLVIGVTTWNISQALGSKAITFRQM